jgi:hypothetical protein
LDLPVRLMKFKIISARLDSKTGLIMIGFRPLIRTSPRAGRSDFTKSYNPTIRPQPDGRPSNLRRLIEAVYGPMPDEQAWEIDLEQMIGHDVPSEAVSGRVFPSDSQPGGGEDVSV